ncbi:hypothetical protein Fot_34555 [Forsythia ovata]|uniref:Uncharacterized protein n=1 Tax=Forsythia ovata TaxID=205694 RepID=A0ABD1SM39_9LAMI
MGLPLLKPLVMENVAAIVETSGVGRRKFSANQSISYDGYFSNEFMSHGKSSSMNSGNVRSVMGDDLPILHFRIQVQQHSWWNFLLSRQLAAIFWTFLWTSSSRPSARVWQVHPTNFA